MSQPTAPRMPHSSSPASRSPSDSLPVSRPAITPARDRFLGDPCRTGGCSGGSGSSRRARSASTSGWTDSDLPTGATLWLYDGSGTMVQGPYTSSDRNADGGLWTPVVLGDELVVELDLPPGTARAEPIFGSHRSTTATEVRRRPHRDPDQTGQLQHRCHLPRRRRLARPDPFRGAAHHLGAYLCTGQLVNTTAEDETPYLLTAQHCVENASQATSVVAFWNYESPTCGMLSGGSLGPTIRSVQRWSRAGSGIRVPTSP